MSFASLFAWMACGVLTGLASQFLIPGRATLRLPMSLAVGIAGAIAGGILFALAQGFPSSPLAFSTQNVSGWFVAILGATIAVWIYPFVHPRGWPR